MKRLWRGLWFQSQQRYWLRDVARTTKRLASHRRWAFLDALGVPGFGTDLMRVDFLPAVAECECWGQKGSTFDLLKEVLDRNRPSQLALLRQLAAYTDAIDSMAEDSAGVEGVPWKSNLFLSPLDMLGLYGMLDVVRPGRYIEIGSGMSTRVALASIQANKLDTHVTCIDPSPRISLPSVHVTHLQQTLESSIESVLKLAIPGSMLFFDGSHRCLPGSDVTVFFLSLLPRLPAGVTVHIHDIFLPWDYPASLLERFWSEQYLLASWLLAGSNRMNILLPGKRLEEDAAADPVLRKIATASSHVNRWSSFWFETV